MSPDTQREVKGLARPHSRWIARFCITLVSGEWPFLVPVMAWDRDATRSSRRVGWESPVTLLEIQLEFGEGALCFSCSCGPFASVFCVLGPQQVPPVLASPLFTLGLAVC